MATRYQLWALANDPGLGSGLRKKIADPANDVFVSAASVWEIALKQRLGKLNVPGNLLEVIEATDFAPLSKEPGDFDPARQKSRDAICGRAGS
jgi:PIN domain nuclease of toxin-antitoxin system